MISDKQRRAILAIVAMLGIGTGAFYALDTYGGGQVQQYQQLKAQGATTVIQAITGWSPCREAPKLVNGRNESLRAARQAGLATAGYFLVSPHESGRATVDRVRANTPDDVWDNLAFLALDFEIPDDCWPTFEIPYQTISDALDRLEELGKPRVIYTSCNEWRNHLVPGNPAKPRDTLLWNASWDNDPDIDYERCPYGGWTLDEVLIEQWSGNVVSAGVYVDQNTLILRDVAPVSTITPTATPAGGCGPAFYSREDFFWAVVALGWVNGLLKFDGPPPELHPFDKAVISHLLCVTGPN